MKFIFALLLIVSTAAVAADEECCTGSCWADGCCPGMKKCHVAKRESQPADEKHKELTLALEKVCPAGQSYCPRFHFCAEDCSW